MIPNTLFKITKNVSDKDENFEKLIQHVNNSEVIVDSNIHNDNKEDLHEIENDHSDYDDFNDVYTDFDMKMDLDEIEFMTNEITNYSINESFNDNVNKKQLDIDENINNKDIHSFRKISNIFQNVFIIPYSVNEERQKPFIQIGLQNNYLNNVDNKLSFIKLINNNTIELDILCYEYLKFNLINYNLKKDENERSIIWKGYSIINDNLYVFYKVNIILQNSPMINKYSIMFMALLHEIINEKKVYDFEIEENVINIVSNHVNLFLLKDENNKYYEIPSVFYTGTSDHNVEFESLFGASKSIIDDNRVCGDGYYFSNFEQTKKSFDNSNHKKNGIIRHVIFTNNQKIITDINDLSKLNDWKDQYDSILIGNIDIEDPFIKKGPVLVIQDYEQSYPISYFYLDKK
jgi:hypothetical protein